MNSFDKEVFDRISEMPLNSELSDAAKVFLNESMKSKYSYNFSWLGRPIIQYPQDIVAMQELIWKIKPDLIIETGIAHGGSLIFSASLLALLDMCDAMESNSLFNPGESKRKVLGVDIDIRDHNRRMIEQHPLSKRIEMIEGSSIDADIINKVKHFAKDYKCILVCLDSNHTHNHVLAELNAYAGLTSINSYCVVFDTLVEDLNPSIFEDKIWSKGDNPKTAVHEFLKTHENFMVDRSIHDKLLVTVATDGYLKRISL